MNTIIRISPTDVNIKSITNSLMEYQVKKCFAIFLVLLIGATEIGKYPHK